MKNFHYSCCVERTFFHLWFAFIKWNINQMHPSLTSIKDNDYPFTKVKKRKLLITFIIMFTYIINTKAWMDNLSISCTLRPNWIFKYKQRRKHTHKQTDDTYCCRILQENDPKMTPQVNRTERNIKRIFEKLKFTFNWNKESTNT